MLVQALTAFAENKLQEQLRDVAFEKRPVPYFLEIDVAGRFVTMVPRFAAVPSKAKVKPGQSLPAPKQRAMDYPVPRSPVTLTSGAYALLGLGELKYVLGAGAWTEARNRERDDQRMQAFVLRLREAHKETQEEALAAALRFYGSEVELERARTAFLAATPGSYVALSVEGKVLTDREPIQAWWQRFYEATSSGRAEVTGECMITGQVGPIPPTHPQIKYTTNIGGKAGVALMSFNAPAFLSYGWEQNANSPVSADVALKYTMALNNMLRPDSPFRKDDGGVAYLFWLRNDAALNPAELVQEDGSADRISQVERVLERDRNAWITDENLFHLVALSANGSRLIVRSSRTELLPEAVSHVIDWWRGLQMQPLNADTALSAPFFWQLKFALDRKGEPPDDLVAALWNRALGGMSRPLGARVMQAILGRMRVDRSMRLDLAALGLLRLSLNDHFDTQGRGRPMSATLSPVLRENVAYVLGNLLALHDGLQYQAFKSAQEEQPNTTVADRFYSLMMNSPAAGEAVMTKLGRAHLRKLRGLQERGRKLACYFEREIGDATARITQPLPSVFNLQDKAHFALGFYHQKAYRPKAQGSSHSSTDETSAGHVAANLLEDIENHASTSEITFFEEIEQ